MTIKQADLEKLVHDQLAHVTALRHGLHQVPEPGFEETETAGIVIKELNRIGLETKAEVGKTGIIADLDSGRPGAYVALRADMDALPIKEHTHAPYESKYPGFTHACGHDGHTASLLGAANVLTKLKDNLNGRIRFLFQPAEEICQGAQAMIDAGIFEDSLPDAILSLHAWPGLPTDSVACRPKTMLASCDVMNIKIIGKGGHGARPKLSKNPLIGMAKVVDELSKLDNSQRIVSLCMAKVGKQANIIANRGRLSGTLRALTKEIRQQSMNEIISLVDKACQPLGLGNEVTFDSMSPAVITDDRLYQIFRCVASELLGEDKVQTLDAPSMGSEDFGSYLQHVPGLLFRVGMGVGSPQLHQANFDFNDEALRTAVLVLAGLAIRICDQGLEQ
jgi:amidohydrolase